MESALRNSEAGTDLPFVELTRLPLFARQANGIITHWSRGSENLYGYSRQEAVGKDVDALLKSKATGITLEAIRATLAKDGVWSGKLTRVSKSGRQIKVDATWEVISADDNRGVLERAEETSPRR
jgi:two-component system CheB/CheR fusion protein